MIETVYISHGEYTRYRVRPNPDCEAVDGSSGVVIEWQDTDESSHKWSGTIFIGPDQIEDLAKILQTIADNVKKLKGGIR